MGFELSQSWGEETMGGREGKESGGQENGSALFTAIFSRGHILQRFPDHIWLGYR